MALVINGFLVCKISPLITAMCWNIFQHVSICLHVALLLLYIYIDNPLIVHRPPYIYIYMYIYIYIYIHTHTSMSYTQSDSPDAYIWF